MLSVIRWQDLEYSNKCFFPIAHLWYKKTISPVFETIIESVHTCQGQNISPVFQTEVIKHVFVSTDDNNFYAQNTAATMRTAQTEQEVNIFTHAWLMYIISKSNWMLSELT